MSDLISRRVAIEALRTYFVNNFDYYIEDTRWIDEVLGTVPPAQTEIIWCKDCKYRDENWRRVSVRWLPCMDMRTGSNWYCGSAERGEQDE